MKTKVNIESSVFLSLVAAGLWEKDVRLLQYGEIDFTRIISLAQEQTVMGLVASGFEHVIDIKIPKEIALEVAGNTLQLEQRNLAMNLFIAKLVKELRSADIYTLLVKGQGLAQCYERPLWRAAGDVDFYLSESNYDKAKTFLKPLASFVEPEDKRRLHFGVTIDPWLVELHGTMHTRISRKMNKVSDEIHYDVFYNGNVRSWNNQGVQVFLPSPDNDVVIVFNHIIDHFYGEGIGLRQVCDWCRLLWTCRNEIDLQLLESRIKKAGLLTEWKSFGTFAVEYLDYPLDAMPFYYESTTYSKKAQKLCRLILETGNFGHNKDNSYREKSSPMKSNIITLGVRFKEFSRISTIFPTNSPKFFINYVIDRAKAVF